MTYLDVWMEMAGALFSQALAGEPTLTDALPKPMEGQATAFGAEIAGELGGRFTVVLDSRLMTAALLGEGADQKAGWKELLKEVADATAGELLAREKIHCRVEKFEEVAETSPVTQSFQLKSGAQTWQILVRDEVKTKAVAKQPPSKAPKPSPGAPPPVAQEAAGVSPPAPSLERLLDVELDATIRFGCRELPLKEILELGPGDVVTLDRHIADPADLIVGNKIVARGEVVLVNGNFGLRVTEVATPQRRLESIRCLF